MDLNESILPKPIIWPIMMNFRWLFLERCNRLRLEYANRLTNTILTIVECKLCMRHQQWRNYPFTIVFSFSEFTSFGSWRCNRLEHSTRFYSGSMLPRRSVFLVWRRISPSWRHQFRSTSKTEIQIIQVNNKPCLELNLPQK